MSSFFDLSKKRRSVRTFNGEYPDEKVLNDLKECAASVTNPYNIPIRFVFLDAKDNDLSSPVLSGEKMYVTAVAKPGEHMEEAYGYSFEALLMHAYELGLGGVWIGGTMPREKFEKASSLGADEVMPCMSPVGVASDKMGMKEALMRKGVKADSRFDFEKLFFLNDFDTPLTEKKAEELGVLDALLNLRLSPSAVNKQPWRVVVCGNEAHIFERHDNGYITEHYDLQKIDIGIAMYHFERELKESGKEPVLEVKDPGIKCPDRTDYVATFRW
ncbi:MAG: nitroreductase [Lachnospiraceae bacterium]|nr:nitroreductase [Lachnospiraceae bacterium]